MDDHSPLEGLSTSLLQLYDKGADEVVGSRQFKSLKNPELDKSRLLASIPTTPQLSHRPLQLLHAILSDVPGPWPTFALIRCYSRLFKALPEEIKAGRDATLAPLVDATANLVKGSYSSFLDFLVRAPRPALRATSSGQFITHLGLHNFVQSFPLCRTATGGRKPVIAIALPNGPLLAAICIAVTTYYTAAPINPAAGVDQFRADVNQAGAKTILTTAEEYKKLQLQQSWVSQDAIDVVLVDWDQSDEIRLKAVDGHKPLVPRPGILEANKPDDIGLILFTSGTSGTKKVVPLTVHSIVSGVIFVMDSWGLTSADVCLNMMPLYHVGGLIRNIFAPIFSGGSTVCCSAFDPNLFWDVVEEVQPTWYYASPSMHSVILAEAAVRPDALRKSRIRLTCNAAGGLLPSLACQLRDTFKCVVLPSYGMTECMPISTPPLDYKLDREGTSGVSTGPELTILDWAENQVLSETVGRICVRGEPVFPGYMTATGSLDKSPFNPSGWFDTGDLGYMDAAGYLYITGRSKEVINRGGELISPFEVENAIMAASMSPDSPIAGRISQALAFSVSHDVLQEVVAVVLVTPTNLPRVDLKTLQSALRSSLQQVKWPVLITYMDDVPKRNNKVLRIKLGQRLGLPEATDNMTYLGRHWQASCPPPDTALSVDIDCTPCAIDYDAVSACMAKETPASFRYHLWNSSMDGALEAFLAPAEGGIDEPQDLVTRVKLGLHKTLHNYMIPERIQLMPIPFSRDSYGNVNEVILDASLKELLGASLEQLTTSTDGKVTKVFADVLSWPPGDLPRDVDFFSLGGDSLRAGKLISELRSVFHVQLPVNLVFNHGTINAISAHIEKMTKAGASDDDQINIVGCTRTNSSTNPFLMLLQLVPLAVLYPLRRSFQWTLFICALSFSQVLPTNESVPGRLFNLTLSIMFSRLVVRCIAPFVGIAAKWLIIGRYREGIFPMWGVYHTRWWMVEHIVSICGKGFFSATDTTRRWYCLMMGAKIGKNVKLAGAALGEWDLLDIRAGATLTKCSCRPFAVEGNASMYLGGIVVGENASIGISSIIAAGSQIPANACIGPNSSSWEVQDADEANRELSPGRAPKPHWLLECLLTVPLAILGWFLSMLPWVGGLVGMVMNQPLQKESLLRDILDWFTAADRIAYHYLALVVRCIFAPFILFAFAVAIKSLLDILFGELGANRNGTVAIWRAALMKRLMPTSRLHDMTGMFGQHYEATSFALRMLGSKVGKRVYWPRTGPGIGDYHLLDVGNDVVFGSRAHLITSDGFGSENIRIRDRAMIADRVCLLPGVDIGERATMGSGALTRRGKAYPADGTFVGSKGGDAVCLSSGPRMHGRQLPRSRIHHMTSDDTLAGDRPFSAKNLSRKKIHHMSSDDTLAESRKSSKRNQYKLSADTCMTSDSDSDDQAEVSFSTDDLSPFGRAFYLKLAPYRVLGQVSIFCYSSFITVFVAFYWNVPSVSSIQLVDFFINHLFPRDASIWMDILALWLLSWITIAILTTLQAVLALLIVVGAKWALIGRRQPGNYDWDKSSYCQRWQLFLCIEKIRRSCYRGHGVLNLLAGTNWIVLYFRALGARIGKDCALFANCRPSLMFTEPDLITLGDRVAVDDASVVAHINTRGKFDLNRLEIGNRCVLRSGSRLLSGAAMRDDSCVLEHTLIMGGDVVEAGWTMQGWPAERFSGQRAFNG